MRSFSTTLRLLVLLLFFSASLTVSWAQCPLDSGQVMPQGYLMPEGDTAMISLDIVPQAGVDYVLCKDGVHTDQVLSGDTADSLMWEVMEDGAYTVVAQQDGCEQTMMGACAVGVYSTDSTQSGEESVTINTTTCPNVSNFATLTGTLCSPAGINVETQAPEGSTVRHAFFYYNEDSVYIRDAEFFVERDPESTYYETNFVPARTDIPTYYVVITVDTTCVEELVVEYRPSANPPPAPTRIDFKIAGIEYNGSPTSDVRICTGERVDAEVSTSRLSNVKWLNNQGSQIGTGGSLSDYPFEAGTYTVDANYSAPCGGSTTPVSGSFKIVEDFPKGGTAKANNGSTATVCQGTSVQLVLTGYDGSILKWEQLPVNSSGGWSDDASDVPSSAGKSSITVQPGSSRFYRAVVQKTCSANGTERNATSEIARVNVNPLPFARISGGATQTIPWRQTSLTLTASGGSGYVYQWLRNGKPIAGATSRSYVAQLAGPYQVRVTAQGCLRLSPPVVVNLQNDYNYVTHRQFQVGYTNPNSLASLSQEQQHEQTTYLDGLGRPLQTVHTQGSPIGQDLIQPNAYDIRGRANKAYLPFVKGRQGIYRPQAFQELADFYDPANPQALTDGRATGSNLFTQTGYEASPLNRVMMTQGPDRWRNHPVEQEYATNPAGAVIRWEIRGGLPVANGKYAANLLYQQTTRDPDGQPTIAYTNKLGQLVLTQTRPDRTTLLSTYRVYDGQGRLRFILPPKAVNNYNLTNQGTLSREDWAIAYTHRYSYDERGRLWQKSVAGTAAAFFIYDERDRLVLSQTGRQRQQTPKQWTFFQYDQLDRPVRQGTYPDDGTYEQVKGRDFVARGALPPDREVLLVYYYDDYTTFTEGIAAPETYADYAFRGDRGVRSYPGTQGLLTATKTKVLGTNVWLYQALYYDDQGQLVQAVTSNYARGKDVISYRYSFHGLLLSEQHQHTSNAAHGNEHLYITTLNTFDQADRLTQVQQRIEEKQGNTLTLRSNRVLAEYGYNSLGQLIEQNLHRQDGTFLQSVDLRYNLLGWLTQVNDASLRNSATNPDPQGPGDLFGLQLYYDAPVVGNQEPRFNGNISAVTWRQRNNALTRSYTYRYDGMDRLKDAFYQQQESGQTRWQAAESRYETRNITYDANGNITALSRFDASNRTLDQLVYRYDKRAGDRLLQVNDSGLKEVGFVERDAEEDYRYDNSGNLTKNLDKEVVRIDYNYLDLPERITLLGNRSIVRTYDASGAKLRETVYYPDGQAEVTTYAAGLVYKRARGRSDNRLDFITHAHGRTKTASNNRWVQQYDLRDQLGNTRVTFNAEPTTTTFTASLETGQNDSIAVREEAVFEQLAETRSTQAYHNSTPASEEEPHPNKVALLNPVSGTVIGPTLSLPVSVGDSVRLQVQASYEQGSDNKPQALPGLVTTLATALGGTVPAGLEAAGASVDVFSEALAGTTLLEDDGNEVPQAFLNYLLYDTAFQLVDQGFVRVSEAAKVTVGQGEKRGLFRKGLFARSSASAEAMPATSNPETLELEVEINQPGYLYAYVSNESNWDAPVFFDGMQARLTEQLTVVDRQDYYPFGATHQALAPNPTNRYLYQGKEITNNLGLGLYDFHARQYDPFLGRFTSIDPMASSFASMSPYTGMGNNPLSYLDPDGQTFVFALMAGAAIGGGAGYLYGRSQGYTGRQMFNSVAGGALLGVGVAAGIETGFFSKVGQGVGNVASQVPGAATNLAQRVFSGAGPTVGMDVATKTASSIIAGPFTQPGLLVDDYGLSHLDYGASYQPSQYAGMNIMQYHQAKTSDGFWNDPVTQGVIELATLPLPVPKLGMGKLFGRLAAKGGTSFAEGSFSVFNWKGYPAGGIKPTGPFRLLEGAEYTSARNLANSTNAAMRRANPEMFKGLQIHEINPVKFGGSPTNLSNKIFLTPSQHAQYTNFWNALMRSTK